MAYHMLTISVNAFNIKSEMGALFYLPLIAITFQTQFNRRLHFGRVKVSLATVYGQTMAKLLLRNCDTGTHWDSHVKNCVSMG